MTKSSVFFNYFEIYGLTFVKSGPIHPFDSEYTILNLRPNPLTSWDILTTLPVSFHSNIFFILSVMYQLLLLSAILKWSVNDQFFPVIGCLITNLKDFIVFVQLIYNSYGNGCVTLGLNSPQTGTSSSGKLSKASYFSWSV